MPIQDSDLFLIEEPSGVSKKIEASKLKANLAANTYNNYKLLVNKPDFSSKFVYAQNMQSSVAPTDWMMVERSDVSYKVLGQEIINFFPSVPAGQAGPITDVGTGVSYSGMGTGTPEQPARGWENAFNGVISTSTPGTTFAAPNNTMTWIPPTPIPVTSEVICYCYNEVAGGLRLNGSLTPATNAAYATPMVSTAGPLGGVLSKIELTTTSGSKGCYLTAVSVDGVLLTDFQSLTLASDANLGDFVNGDAINMVDVNGDVASYVPVTSTITNVESRVETWSNYGVPNPGFTNNFPNWADAFADDRSNWGNAGSGVAIADGSAPIVWEITETISCASVTIGYTFQTGSGGLTVNGVAIATNNSNSTQTVEVDVTAQGGLKKIELDATDRIRAYFFGVYVDGVLLVDDEGLNPELTLTNDQDLKYFKPGDVVQDSGWNQSRNWSTQCTTENGRFQKPINAFDGVVNTSGYLGASGNGTWAPNPVVSFSTSVRILFSYDPTLSPVYNPKIIINGVTYAAGAYNTEYEYFGSGTLERVLVGTLTGYAILIAVFVDGKELVDTSISDPDLVKVISTDIPNNKMTVDGGAWVGSDGTGSNAWNNTQDWSSLVNGTLNTQYSSGDPATVFNSLIGPGYANGIRANDSATLSINFGSTFSSAKSVKIYGYTDLRGDTNAGAESNLKINGSPIAPTGWADNGGTDNADSSSVFTLVSGLTSIEWSYGLNGSGGFVYLQAIEVDGLLLVDTNISGAPVPETEVTGPSKSGTGNFNGNTGAVVDVTNSNGDWIDNQNRLGENFYIKAASTRTGLAVLRTKAIAQAQVWVASANYIADQLVKYDGHYWVSTAEDEGDPPSEESQYWIDLGSIDT